LGGKKVVARRELSLVCRRERRGSGAVRIVAGFLIAARQDHAAVLSVFESPIFRSIASRLTVRFKGCTPKTGRRLKAN
jgi:hypothetical protein